MITSGLCSISFRSLGVEEIIALAGRASLDAVEWGGDVHVPHGDTACAKKVKQQCAAAGIATPAYGSYYRVAESEDEGLRFEDVLSSALALESSTIRVWAGRREWQDADEAYIQKAVDNTLRIADLAGEKGLTVSFEYHEGTLTNTAGSVAQLSQKLPHEAVRFYWQPPHDYSDRECLSSLEAVLDRLTNIHVFQWHRWIDDEGTRHLDKQLLEEGAGRWSSFFKTAAASGCDLCAFLEFTKDNDPENTVKDAVVLNRLIQQNS